MDVPLPNWEDQELVPRFSPTNLQIRNRAHIPEMRCRSKTMPELFRRESSYKWTDSRYNEARHEIERELTLLKLEEAQHAISEDFPTSLETSVSTDEDEAEEKEKSASARDAGESDQ